MKEEAVCLSSAYWAPVAYYTKLYAYSTVQVERYDHYVKQTYRNRCVIASANGPLALIVPTEKSDSSKCLMKDIRISDHGNWQHVHWNAFVSNYRLSPYFDYYADDFRVFYERKYPFLWDFNLAICKVVCDLIDIHPYIEGTGTYCVQLPPGEADFREIIHPKRDWHETDVTFAPVPYYQVFGTVYGFLPNLSIADLLFNMGPESLLVLRDSIRSNFKDIIL